MGKDAGPMTAKAIGKRIKAKGLQKLKFYCQMCQKQCRDANGFKCHMTSEAHQRQLLLFAENPNKYLGSYSDEFLKSFLYLLKTRFGTRRVAINSVYQEYIKDRDHTHLNATRWVTLTGLAKWMGRKGIADVEETEKGWFVTYIDRDHETLEKQRSREKKQKLDKDYEERIAKVIEDQIERGKAAAAKSQEGTDEKDSPSTASQQQLMRSDKITFSLNPHKASTATTAVERQSESAPQQANDAKHWIESTRDKEQTQTSSSKSSSSSSLHRKRKCDTEKKSTPSALEQLRQEEEAKKAKGSRRDHWLIPGIVVKVVCDKLGDKYYKKKAEVLQVIDKYEAIIRMQDSKDQLKLDQAHLQTVIPNVGRAVKVVNGPYVGCDAKLLIVNFDSYSCRIMIESGPYTGRVVQDVQYDEICKQV